MKLRDVLDLKRKNKLRTIDASATAKEAALGMQNYGVRSLLVEEGGKTTRIITTRDLARRAVTEKIALDKKTVKEISSHPIVTGFDTDTVVSAFKIMDQHHIRHLPVTTKEGEYVGIVTEKDILMALVRKMAPKALVLAETARMKSITFDQMVEEFEFLLRQSQ